VKITCKAASELVSQSLDRRLGLIERWRLQAHLKVCSACMNFKNQMSFLRTAIRHHPVFRERDDK
jgi:predicted anti-sigma-YlaC factor YlaD